MSSSQDAGPMKTGQDDSKTTGIIREQIYATLYGQCIGDAVGVMAKCMSKEKAEQIIQRNGILEYSQPVSDAIPWAAGDWTDNSDQMILMMQSLIDNGGHIRAQDFATKLLHWVKYGFKELGDSCGLGIDKSSERIMMDEQFTYEPHKVTEAAWNAKLVPAPNSCVTRTSILGIHEWWNTEHVVYNVLNICKTTHFDPRCHAAAVSFAVAISLMLQKDSQTYENGECNVDILAKKVYKCAMKCITTKPELEALKRSLGCRDISQLQLQEEESDGFQSLGAGFWALRQTNFREALLHIVLSGGDANTNGAVAGALLGCKLGDQKYFPESWLNLKHREWLAGNIERFIAMLERYNPIHADQAVGNANLKENKTQLKHQGTKTSTGRKAKVKQNVAVIQHLNPGLQEQICATVYGQCIGDAIGLLTEFMTKENARRHYPKMPLEYKHKINDKYRESWEIGDWTDDSDQMFLIMQSLIENDGEVSRFDFAKYMVQWWKNGFRDLGDIEGLGIGNTTLTILTDPMFLQDPHQAARDEWLRGNKDVAPNGGVMRTSILGIHDWWDTKRVKKNAMDICKTTHWDPRCQASAVAVSVAISLMLQKKHYEANGFIINSLIDEVYLFASTCLKTEKEKKELHAYLNCTDLQQLKLDELDKMGYTYKCMGAGFWALKQDNFQKALTDIVMSGGDADTNGAVAGALLGCKLGDFQTFPASWLKLKHKEWLDCHLQRFLVMMDRRYQKATEETKLGANSP
ncbi:hypothetical protein ACJMK2_041378 [Sinanodonta woodiana]|uniref:Uncharacterized protein n=1 Tax=Sinanodonta woodiana TaxID=1069815 RepID=A0ABD3W3X8_SINWO